MATGRCNFSVRRGDTFQRTITWKAGPAGKTPVNLTGYTARMAVTAADGSTALTLTDGAGITLGGSAGTIALLFQTAGLTAGCYTYALSLTSGGGVVATLLVGQLDVEG